MRKLFGTVALVGMLVMPGIAHAQLTVGPIAAFHDDFDFGIGGYVGIPVPALDENLSINPSFVYFFPEVGDFWELNGDVVYRFEVSDDTPVLPFAMAGLNIARFSTPSVTVGGVTVGGSNTELGLNLGGGIEFRAESLAPFVGAKFEIQDGSGFVVFGGIGFSVGG